MSYDDELADENAEENTYVIMPNSKFKGIWNMIIIFFMVYT